MKVKVDFHHDSFNWLLYVVSFCQMLYSNCVTYTTGESSQPSQENFSNYPALFYMNKNDVMTHERNFLNSEYYNTIVHERNQSKN